jgi:hypothetical protein
LIAFFCFASRTCQKDLSLLQRQRKKCGEELLKGENVTAILTVNISELSAKLTGMCVSKWKIFLILVYIFDFHMNFNKFLMGFSFISGYHALQKECGAKQAFIDGELMRMKEGEKSCVECGQAVRDEWSVKFVNQVNFNEKCSNDSGRLGLLLDTCERNYTEINLRKILCDKEVSNLTVLHNDNLILVGKYASNETLLEKNLFDSSFSLSECKKERESLETIHRGRLDDMSVDFRLVGEARQCLLQCGGLDEIGDRYMCLRMLLMPKVCSIGRNRETGLSGVAECVLLGDATLSSLNWGNFIVQNPVTSGILIVGVILSVNGLLLMCLWVCVCVQWRRKRLAAVKTGWTQQPSIHDDSVENPNFQPATHTDKSTPDRLDRNSTRPIIKCNAKVNMAKPVHESSDDVGARPKNRSFQSKTGSRQKGTVDFRKLDISGPVLVGQHGISGWNIGFLSICF